MKYINSKSAWFFVRVTILALFVVSSAWLLGSVIAPFLTMYALLLGSGIAMICYLLVGGGMAIRQIHIEGSSGSDITFSFLVTTVGIIFLWPVISWSEHGMKEH